MTESEAITHTKSESGEKLAIHTHLTIEYRIEEFEPMMKSYEPDESLWSEEQAPRAVWKVELYPNGDDEKIKGTVSVYLRLSGPMEDNKERLDATYRICIVDASGNKIDVVERETSNFKAGRGWGCDIDHEQVKKALQADGSLLVTVDVEFLPPDDDEMTAARKGDLISKWHNSIGELRETGAHSDCTLMVGGEQLKAHRLVLSTISPYFEAMFGDEAHQKAKDGIVRIKDPPGMLKDSSAKPYRALLCYAYTGQVDWALYGECMRDVLVLACKYLIAGLKHHVESLLIDQIDTESFAELALLADTYSCDELREACILYFLSNVADLKHHVETLLINEITPESFIELVLLADAYSCDKLKKACIRYLSSNVEAVVLAPQWEVLADTRGDLTKELVRLVRENKTAAEGGGAK